MLPRLFLRNITSQTSSIGAQRCHSSSSLSMRRLPSYRSYFVYGAAISLSICTLSTIYALNNRNKMVIAATPIVNTETDQKQSSCPPWNYSWDGRTKPNTKFVRTITLIRHGQYIHAPNAEDKKLTDLGKKQAKITGEKLKAMNINYDDVICSTMVRAKETADIILKELYDEPIPDIIYDPNLNEGAPCKVRTKLYYKYYVNTFKLKLN